MKTEQTKAISHTEAIGVQHYWHKLKEASSKRNDLAKKRAEVFRRLAERHRVKG